ncbi:MAG: NAD(+) synthase [Bacteroidetes bacterium]|nr:NAD(+) synthase [Bacteroidota bacterium]MCL2302494.1 NAD(+) synthase [Lentimicrobiaceae bacterium]
MNIQNHLPIQEKSEDCERFAKNIRTHIKNYIQENKLQSLVLGISGGIDSALCAALLKPVCEACNIPLIGRSITIETNKPDEIERSLRIGESFCHDFEYLDLTQTYLENKKNLICLDDSMLSKLRQGNMKARMRMMILYDLAQLYRGIVIATDNFTEYLTGFWTLHGDVGDYAPILHLWKTEVFTLATHLLSEYDEQQRQALQMCIDAVPVDGLGISSCDCEQLGVADYFEADKLFIRYFSGEKELESHPLIKRYQQSHYKRSNPVVITRSEIVR